MQASTPQPVQFKKDYQKILNSTLNKKNQKSISDTLSTIKELDLKNEKKKTF